MLDQQYKVFVSYSSKDSEFAKGIAKEIEDSGHRCWVALRDLQLGEDYSDQIPDAISKCKRLLLIYSKNSLASADVKTELKLAVSSKVPIIVVSIDDTPTDKLKYLLHDITLLDANDLHTGKLVQAVVRHIENDDFSYQPKLTFSDFLHKRSTWAGMVLLICLILVVFMGYVGVSTKPTSTFQSPVKLSSLERAHLQPTVTYHEQGSFWSMSVKPPARYFDVVFRYHFSVNGEPLKMSGGNMAGVPALPGQGPQQIEISAEGYAGEIVGPFEYTYDFSKDIQQRFAQLDENDIRFKVEYQFWGEWVFKLDSSMPLGQSQKLLYSLDKQDWKEAEFSIQFSLRSINPVAVDKVYVKYRDESTGSESEVVAIDLDLVGVAKSEMLERAKKYHQLTSNCSKQECRFRSENYQVMTKVEFGPARDQLEFALQVTCDDSQIGSGSCVETYGNTQVKYPLCSSAVFYRAVYIDGSVSPVKEGRHRTYAECR